MDLRPKHLLYLFVQLLPRIKSADQFEKAGGGVLVIQSFAKDEVFLFS